MQRNDQQRHKFKGLSETSAIKTVFIAGKLVANMANVLIAVADINKRNIEVSLIQKHTICSNLNLY